MIDHIFVVDTRYGTQLCAFEHCQQPQNAHVEEAYLESNRNYQTNPYRSN
jgi:hypothetical protein